VRDFKLAMYSWVCMVNVLRPTVYFRSIVTGVLW